jgi:dCTP deaminase
MILTDREIKVAIEQGLISITPQPDLNKALSSTSLDLSIANEIREWRNPIPGVEHVFSPADPEFNYQQIARDYTESRLISEDPGYDLKPHRFILAWTREAVYLPIATKIAARVEGKSSLARLGLAVHLTAPTIHAGFKGIIQLEICNHSTLTIRLKPGMPICQLIFELTQGTPEKGYRGQFFDQTR